MSLVGFQVSKIWKFFGNYYFVVSLKSFAGRSNSLESLAVGLSNSHPYVMEEWS